MSVTVRARALALVMGSALLSACAPEGPLPLPPVEWEVGPHRLAFRVPDGWLHFDHGREQRFERGTLQMSIADLGPVDAVGYARAIEEAYSLWRDDRGEDARVVLGRLSSPLAFPDDEARSAFLVPWGIVAEPAGDRPPGEVDEAYRELLASVAVLPLLDLETLADSALPDLGYDDRRSVADRRPALVDGRDGLWVDTWDRLSHDHRQRFLFVVNEGHLLVARTELGAFSEVEGALEALAESLEFRPEGYR